MRSRTLIAVIAVIALLIPALAFANDGTKGNGLSYCDENYLDLYNEVDPGGPNLVKDGLDGEPVSNARICRKVDILVKLREKQEAAAAEAAAAQQAADAKAAEQIAPTPAPTSEPATSSGGYSIPDYIVQCESGGSYTAQNASGAYGAYQIMPGTAEAYGCDLSTPAGQDACAARIYADVGSSAWSCG